MTYSAFEISACFREWYKAIKEQFRFKFDSTEVDLAVAYAGLFPYLGREKTERHLEFMLDIGKYEFDN